MVPTAVHIFLKTMPAMSSTSQFALGLAICIASLGVGYTIGSRTSAHHTSYIERTKAPLPAGVAPVPEPEEESDDSDDDSDDDDYKENTADGDFSVISAGYNEPCKMVFIVRADLKMTPGKIAAQCGHATLACYKALIAKNPKLVKHWEVTGQAKIALKVTSEDQLLELEAIAKSLNLCARSIQDAGHTQVDPGTRTVLGIGPAPVRLINVVTGQLRLL